MSRFTTNVSYTVKYTPSEVICQPKPLVIQMTADWWGKQKPKPPANSEDDSNNDEDHHNLHDTCEKGEENGDCGGANCGTCRVKVQVVYANFPISALYWNGFDFVEPVDDQTALDSVAFSLDSDPNTAYVNSNGSGSGFEVNRGRDHIVINGLSFTSAYDNPSWDPSSFTLEGSNDDGNSWTELASGDLEFTSRIETSEIYWFDNDVEFEVYRLLFPTIVGTSSDSLHIGGIQFWKQFSSIEGVCHTCVQPNELDQHQPACGLGDIPFHYCEFNLTSCTNGIVDEDETDVDCGGVCQSCAVGKSCLVDTDCVNSWCLHVDVGNYELGKVCTQRTTTIMSDQYIIDNDDTTGVTLVGTWARATTNRQYWGDSYLHDMNFMKSYKKAIYSPNLVVKNGEKTEFFTVYIWYTGGSNRAKRAMHIVTHANGTDEFFVNQEIFGGRWIQLGSFRFYPGILGFVEVQNVGTTQDGYVIADAVMFRRGIHKNTFLYSSDYLSSTCGCACGTGGIFCQDIVVPPTPAPTQNIIPDNSGPSVNTCQLPSPYRCERERLEFFLPGEINGAFDGEILGGLDSRRGSKENYPCSNRGLCDRYTGECKCARDYSRSFLKKIGGKRGGEFRIREDCGGRSPQFRANG